MSKFSVLILILFFSLIQAAEYNITDHGAVPDNRTINTSAIQLVIDDCYDHGGGTVVVPAGTFITGTLHLKSNVNLHLESGAVLKGSKNINDYDPYYSETGDSVHYGILYTLKAENVSITGPGAIDGSEEAFFIWDQAKKLEWGGTKYTRQGNDFRRVSSGIGDGPVVPLDRPYQMVIFSQCTNVLVRDIKLTKSPFWTLHFADCDGVIVSGMKLWNSLETPNSDGIDVTSCSNVLISDCDIRAGDDAIAITGYDHHFEIPGYFKLRHESANINITNCNLQSRSSGIRIGYLDQNSVRNIHISNVNITNSNRGVGIFLRDEGSLENITCIGMTIETRLHTGDWWGNGEPIHISAVRGNADMNVKLGTIKNITFRDIVCKSENGILVYGSKASEIENLRFENIRLELVNSSLNNVAGGNIDLRGCLDEKHQLFAHNIPAVYARFVKGLTLNDVNITWDPAMTSSWFTRAVQVEQFDGINIQGLQGTSAPEHPDLKPVLLEFGKKANVDLPSKAVEIEEMD